MWKDHRRKFLLASGALLAAPLVHAQAPNPGQPRRIGVLGLNFAPKGDLRQRPAYIHFRKLGWFVDENLLVERAYADLHAERLPALAEELVRKRVEVIWTLGSEAAVAAARATQSIPIVFYDPPYPVEQELVDSLARPGRNATGTAYITDSKFIEKNFALLREIAPSAKRLLRLREPATTAKVSGGYFDAKGQYEPATKRLGFEWQDLEIRRLEDIETTLSATQTRRTDALSVSGGYLLPAKAKFIADFALRYLLPSVSLSGLYADAGVLLSYGIAQSEQLKMALRNVEYIDRILRGANPAELPVERPSTFEMVINAKTAQALGIKLPQSFLVRADRLIE